MAGPLQVNEVATDDYMSGVSVALEGEDWTEVNIVRHMNIVIGYVSLRPRATYFQVFSDWLDYSDGTGLRILSFPDSVTFFFCRRRLYGIA